MIAAWNRFFFSPSSPLPMVVLRIGAALVFMSMLIVVRGDLGAWFGNSDPLVSVDLAKRLLPQTPCISLLTWFEPSESFLTGFFAVALAAGVSLCIGWHSRISALICFLLMQSLLHRNPFVVNGADELLSQLLFYIILSEAGALLSIDSLGKHSELETTKAYPWVQRLVQMQLCLVYLQTFFAKVVNQDWINGTALYKVLHSRELVHPAVPLFIADNQALCQYLTWSALGLELLLPVLLWISPVRKWLIPMAISFHIMMDFCLGIPFFQALMILCLLTFVDEKTYVQLFGKLLKLLPKKVLTNE